MEMFMVDPISISTLSKPDAATSSRFTPQARVQAAIGLTLNTRAGCER